MAFCEVKLPKLPLDKPIYEIAYTPMLKRAKTLWLVALGILILGILLAFVIAAMLIAGGKSEEKALEIVAQFVAFVQLLSTLCIAFAFYYLSKLALRRRLFALYAINFALTFAMGVFQFFLKDLGDISNIDGLSSQDSLLVWVYVLYCLIALPILLYIAWQMSKELSFISDEPFFFRGVKIMFVSIAASMAGMFVALVLEALGLEGLAMFLLLACLCVVIIGCLAGSVMYLVGICRLRLIIAYGENVQNPIK